MEYQCIKITIDIVILKVKEESAYILQRVLHKYQYLSIGYCQLSTPTLHQTTMGISYLYTFYPQTV